MKILKSGRVLLLKNIHKISLPVFIQKLFSLLKQYIVMNKSNLCLLILLCLFATANAQTAAKKAEPKKETKQKVNPKQKEQPAVRAKEMVSDIHAVCVLQGEQGAKLTTVFTEYYTKRDGLKKQKDMLDKKVYSEKNKSLRKSKDEKLMTILTAEQFKKWSLNKLDDKKDDKETE